MAISNLPAFAKTLRTKTCVITAAAGNLAADAPTGTELLLEAGADGALVTRISLTPRGTQAATAVVLYLGNASDNGAIKRPFDSVAMALYTESTTTANINIPFPLYNEQRPLRLAAGDRIYVGSKVVAASGLVVKAEFTDF